MLLDKRSALVEKSSSIIGFFREGSAKWELKNRYLTVSGQKAYHYGFACETCSFFFEKLGGANDYIKRQNIVNSLNAGINNLTGGIDSELQRIIPNGEYLVTLQEVKPKRVISGSEIDYFSSEQAKLWNDENSPGTSYYRLKKKALEEDLDFFEFLVPMYSSEELQTERLEYYSERLASGLKPTALSLSIIELKKHVPTGRSHLILTHYLLDGHHKSFTAARCATEITLLSYISLSEGDAYRVSFDHLFLAMNEA